MYLARSKREDGHTAHPAHIARSVAPLCRAYSRASTPRYGRMSAETHPVRRRSEVRRRNNVVTSRFDDCELRMAREFAAAIGASLSAYVRDAAIKRASRPYTTRSQSRVISELAGIVGLLKQFRSRFEDPTERKAIEEIILSIAAVSDSIAGRTS